MGSPPWAVRARRLAASAMPPANEEEGEEADFELPSPGSAEVATELLLLLVVVLLRPAEKADNFLELLAVRANRLGGGAAKAREGECMPTRGGEEGDDDDEAARVLPPLRKQRDAIFERSLSR